MLESCIYTACYIFICMIMGGAVLKEARLYDVYISYAVYMTYTAYEYITWLLSIYTNVVCITYIILILVLLCMIYKVLIFIIYLHISAR